MSGGPRTPAGKAITRYNGRTHGLNTFAIAIPGVESEADWDTFHAAAIEDLAPAGVMEYALASRATELMWRIRRAARAEHNLIAARQEVISRQGNAITTATYRYLPAENEVNVIVRYEGHLSRQLYQALHELEASQRRRRGEDAPLARIDVTAIEQP
ncbi:MAG TPA: hypothetical protein VIH21_00035 [Dehalococcoidia bacterium]